MLNRQDEKGRTPLKLGVEEHSIEIIKACVEDEELREVIDWDKEDSIGVSPILEATLREDIEMCRVLEVVAKRAYEERIIKAVEAGKIVILKELLREVNINRYGGEAAVDISIRRQDVDTLKLLLKYGAKVSDRLQKVGMMLFKERKKDIYEELLEITEIKSQEILSILMRGVDEEERDKTGLMYAIEGECSIEVLKKIVTRMSIEEVLKEDIDGNTIRMYEIAYDKYVREYVEELYSLYNRAKEGIGEILALSYGGNIELVERLIEEGVNLDEADEDGSTALMCAVLNGHIELVDKLIEAEANIDAVDRDGDTVLMYGVYSRNMEILLKLIDLGMNLDEINRKGETALILAVKIENIELVEKLIALGANINFMNEMGETALIVALKKGNIELVERLLELGAGRTTTNK